MDNIEEKIKNIILNELGKRTYVHVCPDGISRTGDRCSNVVSLEKDWGEFIDPITKEIKTLFSDYQQSLLDGTEELPRFTPCVNPGLVCGLREDKKGKYVRLDQVEELIRGER